MADLGNIQKVDPNGRLLIPAERRRIVSGADGVIAVVHVLDPWRPLLLLSPSQHLDLLAGLRAKTRRLDGGALIVSRYEEETVWRSFDPTGRLTLPPELLGDAGIGTEAVVAGTHRIALFGPDSWRERQAERDAAIAGLPYAARLSMVDIPALEEGG
ncbi:hypothetical protein IIA16_06100 [bacterium]|nr:hypothetical protein [bacterium]